MVLPKAEITQMFSLTKVVFLRGGFVWSVGVVFTPDYFSDLTHTIASQSAAENQLKG